MPYYSLQADFENIDAPELIAASLSILQKEGWAIKDYKDIFIKAEKVTVNNQNAELIFSVSRNEVTITCTSDLAEQANQFIVDSFAQSLHKFVSSPSFDNEVRSLKHHYFMNNPMENSEEESNQDSNKSEFKTFFSFRKNCRVTPAIISINVLVLLVMVLTGISPMLPDPIEMLKWGGLNRSLVLNGDWWRLVTSCFLHYGIIHIAFNMWALYSIGMFLERMIGSWRFAFAYLIAGLAGGLNSIVWHSFGAGAGASGAIFGMFGLFLALLTTNILEKGFRTAMLRSVVPMILFNLLIGTAGQIDNAAHLGGMISGMACGYLFAWHFKNPRNKAIDFLSFVLPAVLVISSGFIINKNLPDPFTDYEKIVKTAITAKVKALKLEEKLGYDDEIVLNLWDTAIASIKQAQNHELGPEFEPQNARRLFYFQKRKQEAILLNKTPQDTSLINQVQHSIDSMNNILTESGE